LENGTAGRGRPGLYMFDFEVIVAKSGNKKASRISAGGLNNIEN